MTAQTKWTRALWEPAAGVEANKACVALGDVHGNNDHQLLLVDENETPNRLKLYKGLKVEAESILSETPAGIISFISDAGQLETPCLAVASGASLLIYRNMKPYYRYNVPSTMDILPAEQELWSGAKRGQIRPDILCDGLKNLQMEHSIHKLSTQSQQLLTLDSPEERQVFIAHTLQTSKGKEDSIPLTNMQITCLTTIPRNSAQGSSVDVLVVGTEQCSVYFIDSQAYTVLHRLLVAAIPFKLLGIGQYDLEFRLVIVTRQQEVCIFRRNIKGESKEHTLFIREFPFDVIHSGSQLVFATRKKKLIFFSLKGKRQNALDFDEDIVDIETFYYEPKQYNGVLVAVGKEIQLYVDQFRVDTIRILDLPMEWMRFGRMGREEGVLVVGTQGGGLCVKIFRRVATLDQKEAVVGSTGGGGKALPPPLPISLQIPKKSKSFVDQSLRERENPQLLHQIYQRDWFMLKYHTAKTYAALESGKTELLPSSEAEPFQISYDVLGFGPKFKLLIKLITPMKLPSQDRWLCFLFNQQEYSFSHRMIPLPPLLKPNCWFSFAAEIECLHPDKQLQEEEVRIVLVRKDWTRPLWMTSFQMPMSETAII